MNPHELSLKADNQQGIAIPYDVDIDTMDCIEAQNILWDMWGNDSSPAPLMYGKMR